MPAGRVGSNDSWRWSGARVDYAGAADDLRALHLAALRDDQRARDGADAEHRVEHREGALAPVQRTRDEQRQSVTASSPASAGPNMR